MWISFLICFCVIIPMSGTANVAFKKPATQSSNASSKFTADKAVDGIKNTGSDQSNLCAFTLQEPTTWWQVDLGKVYEVKAVTLTTRQTNKSLKNITITLSNEVKRPEMTCLQNQELNKNPAILNCMKRVTGRYLRISQTLLKPAPLILCEVEVHGTPPKQLYEEYKYHQLLKRIQSADGSLRTRSFTSCALICSKTAGCDKFQWKNSQKGDNNCKIGGVTRSVLNKDDWVYFENITP